MARHFVLHAPNVHQGGGATLLRGLLRNLPPGPGDLILDRRYPDDVFDVLPEQYTRHRISATIGSRIQAERLLARLAGPDSQVLCFSGMPPLFRCRGHVSVFVQNLNLISPTDLSQFPYRQQVRIHLERLWFSRRMHHADEFLVQTATMRDLLLQQVPAGIHVCVRPFVPDRVSDAPSVPAFPAVGGVSIVDRMTAAGSTGTQYDFCYVATGEPNKNHRRLVDAWRLLAEQGRYPSLCVTISPRLSPELAKWIDLQARRYQLRIDNVGYVSREEVDLLYRHSRWLIFPSLYESFGLPLLEAREHGLPIVAAERDYVRDVVVPDHTFDPDSSRSIARAVERALGLAEVPPRIANPAEFLSEVLAA